MAVTNLEDIKKMPEIKIDKPKEGVSIIHIPKGLAINIRQNCKEGSILIEKTDMQLGWAEDAPSLYIKRKNGIYSKGVRKDFNCRMNLDEVECVLETRGGGDITLDEKEDFFGFTREGEEL